MCRFDGFMLCCQHLFASISRCSNYWSLETFTWRLIDPTAFLTLQTSVACGWWCWSYWFSYIALTHPSAQFLICQSPWTVPRLSLQGAADDTSSTAPWITPACSSPAQGSGSKLWWDEGWCGLRLIQTRRKEIQWLSLIDFFGVCYMINIYKSNPILICTR